jgi:hypothetical protein
VISKPEHLNQFQRLVESDQCAARVKDVFFRLADYSNIRISLNLSGNASWKGDNFTAFQFLLQTEI